MTNSYHKKNYYQEIERFIYITLQHKLIMVRTSRLNLLQEVLSSYINLCNFMF